MKWFLEVEKYWGHKMYFCGDELGEILNWMIRASVAIGCLWVGFGHGHLRHSTTASQGAGLAGCSVEASGSTSIDYDGTTTWTRRESKRQKRQKSDDIEKRTTAG